MTSIVRQIVLYLVINHSTSSALILTHGTVTSSQTEFVTSPSRYVWRDSGQFSECSVTCGQGVELTVVVCRDSVTGSRVRDELCSIRQHQRPAATSRLCQPHVNCKPWWVVDGTWSTCSKSCDVGLSRRLVYCVEELNDGTIQRTLDTRCTDKKPETQRLCNTQQCSTWVTGPWSQCSVTCDDGIQHRVVVCKQTDVIGCEADLKPLTQQVCHRVPCHVTSNSDLSVDIKHKSHDWWSSPFTTNQQQFNNKREFSRQQAEQQQIKDSIAPAHTSRFPVPSSNSRTTDGPRTAPDIRQSVILIYNVDSTKDDLLTVDRHNTLDDKELLQEDGSGEEETLPSSIVTAVTTTLTTTPSSIVTFTATSTEVEQTEKFELSNKTSYNNNIYQLYTVTARWKAITEYGECSVRCGGYGIRQRQVECVLKRYSDDVDVVVPSSCCRWQLKPVHQILCYQGPCNVQWAAVGWSQCSETCGVNSITTRVFQCIQHLTSIVVDNAYCYHLKTPVLDTHRCYLPACVTNNNSNNNNNNFSCHDNSVYCSLVAQLRLCRLSLYKQQCCYSCSHLAVVNTLN